MGHSSQGCASQWQYLQMGPTTGGPCPAILPMADDYYYYYYDDDIAQNKKTHDHK